MELDETVLKPDDEALLRRREGCGRAAVLTSDLTLTAVAEQFGTTRYSALEDQLRRAASSIGLNIAEAALSDPGNKRARFHTAAGSARETQHALRQAIAWRHVRAIEAERALGLVRRLVAILWRITRG